MRFSPRILRAPDDGGAPPPPAAPPAAPPADPGAAAPPADPPPPAPPGNPPPADPPAGYFPEGLDASLRGADDKTTIDNLAKAVQGFRKSQGERGEVPKDAAGYKLEPSEKVAPYLATAADQAILNVVAQTAHASGLTTKQYSGFVNQLIEAMATGNMLEAPFDPVAEGKALFPDITDDAERGREVDRRIRDNAAWIGTLEARGMAKESVLALQSMLDYAPNIRAIEYFRQELRETAPALAGAGAGGVTEADLQGRMRDPRQHVGNPKYEAAYAAETDRMYRQFYGDRPRA